MSYIVVYIDNSDCYNNQISVTVNEQQSSATILTNYSNNISTDLSVKCTLNIKSQITLSSPTLNFNQNFHFINGDFSNHYEVVSLFVAVNYCPPDCENCDATSYCTSCISTKRLSNGLCVAGCEPTCQTCSGSTAKDCILCASAYSYYQISTSLCVPSCSTGEYVDSTTNPSQKQCRICNSLCSTCTDSTVNVPKCFCKLLQLSSNTCVTSCLSSEYKFYNSSVSQNQCQTCDSTCQTCSGSTNKQCILCDPNYPYYQLATNQCIPQCLSTEYVQTVQVSSQSQMQCVSCSSSCATCSGSATNCTSCFTGTFLFNNTCVLVCPNGYIKNYTTKNCDLCSDPTYLTCYSCNVTCKQCLFGSISSTECTTCYPTKQLQSDNSCACLNPNDTRNNFFQCSYQNIAVLDITLSASQPQLQIDFGSPLNSIGTSSNIPSSLLCSVLFDSSSMDLIDSNSQCQISTQYIIVILDEKSTVIEGDTLNLNSNILSFVGETIKIDTFYLNIVKQNYPGVSQLLFNSMSVVNSCNNIFISLTKIMNDAKRGLLTFAWNIVSVSVTPTSAQLSGLDDLISDVNTNKITDLNINRLLIPADSTVLIEFNYKLKVNQEGKQSFSINFKKEKMIYVSYYQSRYPPIYRYHNLSYYVSYITQICDQNGIVTITEPTNISISSTQVPSINSTLNQYTEGDFEIDIPSYTMQSSSTVDLILIFSLESDKNVNNTTDIEIDVLMTALEIRINGGINQIVDYTKNVTLTSISRDYELQNSSDPQLIDLTWSCENVITTDGLCNDYNGNTITLLQNTPSNTILSRTFSPYSVLKFTLDGKKDSRESSYSTVCLFTELDIPVLTVLTDFDQENQKINLNEDITFTLQYDNSFSSDILSYAGAILYQNNVVGTLKFDYYIIRLRIWDYFQNVESSNQQLQIRFSVYNPTYVMPSLSIINININLPPTNCNFVVTPLQGISLTTNFVLSFDNCYHTQLPLTYQFFYYNTAQEFSSELISPWNIVRRQIQDQSNINTLTTILPEGNLLLLAQVMDNQLGIYNATQVIKVSSSASSENDYSQIVQSTLASSSSLALKKNIINECILGEDISKQEQFNGSTTINSLKLSLIQSLSDQSIQLPRNSLLSTFANKIIAQLQTTLITQPNQDSIISRIQNLLKMQQLNVANSNSSQLMQNNNYLMQNLVDSFKMLNSTTANNITNSDSFYQSYNNISTQVGMLINNNSIPNSGVLILQGNLLNLTCDSITQKNLYKYARQISEDASNQTETFSVVSSAYSHNIYENTTAFQNYTSTFLDNIADFKVTSNKLISPQIINATSQQLLKDSFVFYNFPQANINKTQNMTCIQQEENTWSKKKCNLYLNKENNYTCICNSQLPTTISEDISDMLLNNENLQTAFSSQGLSNLFNFSHPEKYAIFWILISFTILQVGLYCYGKKLDTKFRTRVHPISLQPQELQERINESPIISSTQERNQELLKEEQISNGSQEQMGSLQQVIEDQSNQRPNQMKIDTKINSPPDISIIFKEIVIQDGKNQQINTLPIKLEMKKSQKKPERDFQEEVAQSIQTINCSVNKKSNQFNQDPKNGNEQQSSVKLKDISLRNQNNNNDSPIITPIDGLLNFINNKPVDNNIVEGTRKQPLQVIYQSSNRNIGQNVNDSKTEQAQKSDEEKMNTIMTQHEMLSSREGNSNKQTQNKNNDNLQIYISKQVILQFIIFHQFFGIFYIYDKQLSRPTRLQLFYIRIVHSLAISIIFGSYKAFAQQIVVALINSIVIETFSAAILFTYKKGKIGKSISIIIQLFVLVFYYYIILAIQSGKEPEESNEFILLFFLMVIMNLFVVCSFVASAYMIITKKYLDSKEGAFLSRLYNLLKIQQVLDNASY